jgi:hypothetical protein
LQELKDRIFISSFLVRKLNIDEENKALLILAYIKFNKRWLAFLAIDA